MSLETDFDGCMKVMQELTEDGSIYLANSMNSLRIEGQKTVAVEIVQQFDWAVPDWVVIPGGNLGNVYALGKGFLMMRDLGLISRLPRICVAQAAHANPLYRAYHEGLRALRADHRAADRGERDPDRRPGEHRARDPRAARRSTAWSTEATEDELADAVARADATGMYNCPHTGVALAATEKLAREGVIPRDARVVVVSTAHGLKFTEFKRAITTARCRARPRGTRTCRWSCRRRSTR